MFYEIFCFYILRTMVKIGIIVLIFLNFLGPFFF